MTFRPHSWNDELSKQFELNLNQITQWKQQLLERAGEVFEGGTDGESGGLARDRA